VVREIHGLRAPDNVALNASSGLSKLVAVQLEKTGESRVNLLITGKKKQIYKYIFSLHKFKVIPYALYIADL